MEDDVQNLTNASRKLGQALEDKRQATLISSIVSAIKGIRPPAPRVTVNVPKITVPKAKVEVTIPPINVPEANVNVSVGLPEMPEIKIPPIKIPKITVPKPEVTVNIPPIPAPIVNIPETVVKMPEFPKTMKVIHVDESGKPVQQIISVGGGGGGNRLTPKEKVIGAVTDGSATVGTTSTEILGKNADRHTFTIVNDSDAVIYLKYGGTAVLNSGVRISAEGGSHTSDIYTGAVVAISTGAGKNVTIMEL